MFEKREELVALADRFDDIAVDADGKCYWCDVANAQTYLRAELRRFAAQESASPPEREAKLREALERIVDPTSLWSEHAKIAREALSLRDDGEAKIVTGDEIRHYQAEHEVGFYDAKRALTAKTSEAPSTIPGDVTTNSRDGASERPVSGLPATAADGLTCGDGSERRATFSSADVLAMKEACRRLVLDAKAREVEVFDAANRDMALSDTGRQSIQDRALARDSILRDIAAAIDRLPVPSSTVQDEAVAWQYRDTHWQDDRWHVCAERPNDLKGRLVRPLYTRPPAKADAGEIDVPGKTAGELKPWRAELDEVIGHLGAAVIQSTAFDDQIIMDHVKAAHEIAKIVRRKA